MAENVKDKVVVITGASSGIGESIAKLLSEKGAKLVLGARRIDKLNALKSDLKTEVIAKSTDVTNPQDVEALVQNAIEIFGRVDVLINNAGLMPQSFLS